MADSDTYLIKSIGFTPDSGTLLTIDGIEEVTVRQNGQVVAHGHDASLTITAHFVDNIEAQVSVRTKNGAHFVHANLQLGLHGALVIVAQKRKAGKGAVSGADKTITAAQATVTGASVSLPTADRSNGEFEFACADSANAAPLSFS